MAMRKSIPGRSSLTSASVMKPGRKSLAQESAVKRVSNIVNGKGGEETNVSVYVRCRSRNTREIKENSGVVVSTLGHKGKDVILQTGPMSVSNKTYTFDGVYGAESDQEIVFEGIAKNVLDEVLEGYNCTVFAYGQTGTGKTYTMSGDFSVGDNGILHEDAGIIPRTLVSLFKSLEALPDFSVKISFIELYNEDLRDLLVLDPSLERKVRIYDDPNKKSIVVQGMEEIYIKSAKEGLGLLEEGSLKRQVASTQCNDLSSRSHTVFTITINMKQMDLVTGEEILKVGKLNLVDLAGSENISRSGAENKRAREAGMINQSLLTLGRVINALVDQSPHIPYRESKLTRLLQDSLGGKTKTCLIATISPAKVSLDETLSTLEYASRAKNIKNKPQVNSTMSKKMMISEYIEEIERLRNDLNATRAKNGIYMTEENLNQITAESESRRIMIEEQRMRIELLDDQIKKFKSNFEAQLEMFAKNEQKLIETEGHLEHSLKDLHSTEALLDVTRTDLQNEIAIREEYEKTEKQLKDIGHGFIKLLDDAIILKKELYDCLRKKEKIELENVTTFNDTKKSLVDVSNTIQEDLLVFENENEKSSEGFQVQMDEIVKEEQATLSMKIARIEAISRDFNSKINEVIHSVNEKSSRINADIDKIDEIKHDIDSSITGKLTKLNGHTSSFMEELQLGLNEMNSSVSQSYYNLGQQFNSAFEVVHEQLVTQEKEISELKQRLIKHNDKHTESLMTEQEKISNFLAEEEDKSREEEQEFTKNLTDMISVYSSKRKRRYQDAIENLNDSLASASKKNKGFASNFSQATDNWFESQKIFRDSLNEEKSRIGNEITIKEESSTSLFGELGASVLDEKLKQQDLFNSTVVGLKVNTKKIGSFANTLKEMNVNNNRSTINSVNDIQNLGSGSFKSVSKDYGDFGGQLNHIKSKVVDTFIGGVKSVQSQHKLNISRNISKLEDITNTFRLKRDDSNKPIDNGIQYARQLPSTKSHSEIIRERESATVMNDEMEIDDKENVVIGEYGKASQHSKALPIPDQVSKRRVKN